jgi:hypothetical protein
VVALERHAIGDGFGYAVCQVDDALDRRGATLMIVAGVAGDTCVWRPVATPYGYPALVFDAQYRPDLPLTSFIKQALSRTLNHWPRARPARTLRRLGLALGNGRRLGVEGASRGCRRLSRARRRRDPGTSTSPMTYASPYCCRPGPQKTPGCVADTPINSHGTPAIHAAALQSTDWMDSSRVQLAEGTQEVKTLRWLERGLGVCCVHQSCLTLAAMRSTMTLGQHALRDSATVSASRRCARYSRSVAGGDEAPYRGLCTRWMAVRARFEPAYAASGRLAWACCR